MSSAIGIRHLKNHASAVLRRTRRGETLTVTDRGQPIAVLVPIMGRGGRSDARLQALVSAGRVAWSGGKPRGLDRAPRLVGRSVADAVIEDRR